MLRLTRAQVREIDRRAIEEYHIPGIVLMENAARAAAAVAMEMSGAPASAVIVCGGGNNGGDGYAIARHLHNADWSVLIVQANERQYTGDALINRNIAEAMGIAILPVERFEDVVFQSNLVIDALFGTGLITPPRQDQAELIVMIGRSGTPVLAVDIPSGLDCDTGLPLGPSCVRATKTVTFVAEKAGFANPDSRQYTGEVIVGDIGCPRELIAVVHGQTS